MSRSMEMDALGNLTDAIVMKVPQQCVRNMQPLSLEVSRASTIGCSHNARKPSPVHNGARFVGHRYQVSAPARNPIGRMPEKGHNLQLKYRKETQCSKHQLTVLGVRF